MKNFPFFYVPVDIELLRQFSDDITMEETTFAQGQNTKYLNLPIPETIYAMNVILKEHFNKKYVNDVALQAGLNPKYFIHTPNTNLLYGGLVCTLKGREGYWCMATHCGDCVQRFLGNTHRCQCDAPNCANNIRFRRRFIHDD